MDAHITTAKIQNIEYSKHQPFNNSSFIRNRPEYIKKSRSNFLIIDKTITRDIHPITGTPMENKVPSRSVRIKEKSEGTTRSLGESSSNNSLPMR